MLIRLVSPQVWQPLLEREFRTLEPEKRIIAEATLRAFHDRHIGITPRIAAELAATVSGGKAGTREENVWGRAIRRLQDEMEGARRRRRRRPKASGDPVRHCPGRLPHVLRVPPGHASRGIRLPKNGKKPPVLRRHGQVRHFRPRVRKLWHNPLQTAGECDGSKRRASRYFLEKPGVRHFGFHPFKCHPFRSHPGRSLPQDDSGPFPKITPPSWP